MPKQYTSGIVVKDGKMLLMRRVNNGSEYYTLPGGKLDEDESLEEGTLREIREETSIGALVDRLVYKITWDTGNENHYFICDYISGTPQLLETSEEFEQMKDGSQIYDPQWFPVKDLPNIPLHPVEVRDLMVEHIQNGFPDEMAHLSLILGTRKPG